MHACIKRGLAALAAPAAALGLLAAASSPALASSRLRPTETTVCNHSTVPCTHVSSLLLNQGNQPSYVLNATVTGGTSAQPAGRQLNLRPASGTARRQDFVIREIGRVGHLCGAPGTYGLDPASYACLNYPGFYPVYELQFAPDSIVSGDCAGATSVTGGQPARLEKCGGPATSFVPDLAFSVTMAAPAPLQPLAYFPLADAANISASNPLVLTLNPQSASPADGLFLEPESFTGGAVPDDQLFALTGAVGLSG